MATLSLAHWALSIQPSNVPPSVLNAARRSLYNYIGCAIGGSNHPTVKKAFSALEPFFGKATSTLLGHQGAKKADAQHAALLNGIASHVHDYDDTHLATIIHPTGPIASALLAYAEFQVSSPNPATSQTPTGPVMSPLYAYAEFQESSSISGEELLCALIAGIEVACKLGLAVWPTHYDVGWHITSTTGSIGAAVAVAKLMNLTVEATAHAIGIAATQVTGLREMFGSDTKSFHPGRAAQNGLMAAILAERGYTATHQAIEAKRGWANVVVCGGEPKLETYAFTDGQQGLGKVWEVEKNAFKPFPCGIVCHPAMDGCLQLHRELKKKGLSIADVERVDLKVHPLVLELTGKRKPKDGLEGKFSVFHGCAVALLYGKAGPAEYADHIVTSREVIELRDKIDAVADAALRADESLEVITFKSGTKLENHIEHAVGSLEVPMTDEQLTEKFVDHCSLVLGAEGAKHASDLAWGIGREKEVSSIVSQL